MAVYFLMSHPVSLHSLWGETILSQVFFISMPSIGSEVQRAFYMCLRTNEWMHAFIVFLLKFILRWNNSGVCVAVTVRKRKIMFISKYNILSKLFPWENLLYDILGISLCNHLKTVYSLLAYFILPSFIVNIFLVTHDSICRHIFRDTDKKWTLFFSLLSFVFLGVSIITTYASLTLGSKIIPLYWLYLVNPRELYTNYFKYPDKTKQRT